jgi:uncharacterized membrane protein (DUF2068 family)
MEKHPKGFVVRHFGIRTVALFEAGKGVLALLASVWVITLRHKDMKEVAQRLLDGIHRVLHINPDRHFFQLMMRSLGGVTPKGVAMVALAIFAYAIIRFIEATGLWLEKEWAEWFALLSGAFYAPFLIYELIRRPAGYKWLGLALNLLVVMYLAWLLRDSYRRRARQAAALADQRAALAAETPQFKPGDGEVKT